MYMALSFGGKRYSPTFDLQNFSHIEEQVVFVCISVTFLIHQNSNLDANKIGRVGGGKTTSGAGACHR